MAVVNPWAMGAVGFVQIAAGRRAATYRKRATQFVELAKGEPISRIRSQLFGLAAQYEELAADLQPFRVG